MGAPLRNQKQYKVDTFKDWLVENDIEFVEHANGHFQIFMGGNKYIDVWATTERSRLVTGDGYVGFNMIHKQILDYRDAYFS